MSRIETIQLEWFSVDEKLPELKHTCYYDGDKYSDEVWFRHKDIIEWCYPPVDIH